MPSIRKAQRITGNQYVLRNVGAGDAGFIVALRTDAHKRRYISETSAALAQQIEWIKQYKRDANQAYFMIESMSGEKAGTIRMYDPHDDSFCFGSWIVRHGEPAACAVESILMLYHYALDVLGFSRSYFAVRKPNRSVWHFMEQFGAQRTGETAIDYLYQTERAPVLGAFRRYAKFLPHPIRVIDDPVS